MKNGAKALKNQRNLEWCKGKNVELKIAPFVGKLAFVQPRTSLGKGLRARKNGAKVLMNQRNLEWCKGKNIDLEKINAEKCGLGRKNRR